MIQILAAVGFVTLIVLMWKAFGPANGLRPPAQRGLGPDDDPEFLRRIGKVQANEATGPGETPIEPDEPETPRA